mgnify:FL=1|tara:strand:- start:333 stop:1115 length:783 start_codon:yes stop_codon:yes gene_type:complete
MISVIRSGLAGITQEISVISNNIANASSIGFKKSTASFEDVFSEQNEKRSASLTGFGITLKQPQRIHSQGSLKETGQALDMGIVGNGMFLLDSREDTGVVTYSRAGSFSVNNQGFIVNMDNIPILDKNQNSIKLPFNVSVDGKTPQKLTNVKVEPDGKIKASYGTSEFLTIGQVGLAKFSNEAGLRSIGESNFLQTTESGIPTIGNPKDLGFGSIQNGSLENSNTEISDELVKLIRAQQAFNGNAKMLETERKATELLMR